MDPVPHRDEGLRQVLHAEEVHHDVRRLIRRLLRVALREQVEVPRFPRDVRADQRRAERFGRAGHRVHGLRRARGQQQVHPVAVDGLLGQLAGPGRAGLGVVGLDGDVVGLAADLEPVLVLAGRLDLRRHEVVRRAEPGERAGERVDPADRDLPGGGSRAGAGGGARAGALDAGAARLEQSAAPDDGRTDAGHAQQAASADAVVRLRLPEEVPPGTPREMLSFCAVWSLMCNRSPLRSRRGAGPRMR